MNNFSGDLYETSPFPEDSVLSSGEMTEADVQILTSAGLRIPAHASILVILPKLI